MTDRSEILEELKTSIETWDVQKAVDATNRALEAGIEPKDIVNDGLGKGMEDIGKRFDAAEIFLPQVVAASKTMEAALKILGPVMSAGDSAMKGTVVMGTVEGDIHEIGKNVCCAMLRGAGFRVVDLGTDVDPDKFVKAVEKHHPDVVGASALMTVSLPQQRQLVRIFKENGMSVLTIFGGAPCSQEWVDEIGGDGYSDSGASIVRLVRSLLGVDNQAESGQKDYIGIDRDWEPDDGQTLCRHFRGI